MTCKPSNDERKHRNNDPNYSTITSSKFFKQTMTNLIKTLFEFEMKMKEIGNNQKKYHASETKSV